MQISPAALSTDVELGGVLIDIIFLGVFVKYIVALASGQRVSVHNPSAALRRSLSLNQKIRVGWAAGDHRVVEG
jgi:hypothetical protein